MNICYSVAPPQFWEHPDFWLFAATVAILAFALLLAAYALGRRDQQRVEETPLVFVVEPPEVDERAVIIQEQALRILELQGLLAAEQRQVRTKTERIEVLERAVASKETLRARYYARLQKQQQSARAVWGQLVAAIDHGDVVLA